MDENSVLHRCVTQPNLYSLAMRENSSGEADAGVQVTSGWYLGYKQVRYNSNILLLLYSTDLSRHRGDSGPLAQIASNSNTMPLKNHLENDRPLMAYTNILGRLYDTTLF